MSSEIERAQNFGNMLAKSRTDAGKTRKQMAKLSESQSLQFRTGSLE